MVEIVKHISVSNSYLDHVTTHSAMFMALGIVSVIFAFYLLWLNAKSKFNFVPTLCVFFAILGIGLTAWGKFHMVNATINGEAYNMFTDSFMSNTQEGNLVYGNAFTVLGGNKKQILSTIYAEWRGDDETELATVMSYPTKKKMVYCSKSKLGRAFLRVGAYVDKNAKHPVNVVWKLMPYQAQCSYDTSSGHHKVICRVDSKKVANGDKVTVVKY